MFRKILVANRGEIASGSIPAWPRTWRSGRRGLTPRDGQRERRYSNSPPRHLASGPGGVGGGANPWKPSRIIRGGGRGTRGGGPPPRLRGLLSEKTASSPELCRETNGFEFLGAARWTAMDKLGKQTKGEGGGRRPRRCPRCRGQRRDHEVRGRGDESFPRLLRTGFRTREGRAGGSGRGRGCGRPRRGRGGWRRGLESAREKRGRGPFKDGRRLNRDVPPERPRPRSRFAVARRPATGT